MPEGEMQVKEESKMRGPTTGLVELIEQAKWYEKQGNMPRAIKAYESALQLIAEPLNNLAWLYHTAGRDKDALSLAQLATQFAPNIEEFTDTLSAIQGPARKE
jgi:tetratricopeptide (TPR) repeat protein